MVEVIYGSDAFLVKEKIQSIKSSLEDVEEFVQFSSSDRGFELSQITEACRTISLFSERKCVTFLIDQDKDLAKLDEPTLIDLIEKPNYDVTLIIWFIKKPLAKTKLKKSIDKFAKLSDIKGLSSNDFEKRLNHAITSYGIKFDVDAKREFIARLDGDLIRLEVELNKLMVLGRSVTLKDVTDLVSDVLDDRVFEFTKALVGRDANRAFTMYQGFLEMKMEPLAFMGMVAYSLRNLFQVSLLTDLHMSKQEIGTRLGMSPYIVGLSQNDRSAKTEFVLSLLNELASIDQKIKLGKADRFLAFELFMIEVIRS